jgi:hypothetical protein
MYKDKVSRGLCRSWITLMTLITLGLVATIALLEAQQPSNVPAVKATGAQSGVLREMAELKPDVRCWRRSGLDGGERRRGVGDDLVQK